MYSADTWLVLQMNVFKLLKVYVHWHHKIRLVAADKILKLASQESSKSTGKNW